MKRSAIYSLLTCLLLVSCQTPKNITYMQGFENGQAQNVALPKRLAVMPDDELTITVSSQYPELAEVFNLVVAQRRIGLQANTTYTSDSKIACFHVDQFGDIDYPLLGTIHVGGLTRTEVAEKIKNSIIKADLLKDPVVTVIFNNAIVSVIGDVKKPGDYAIDRDDLTVLQAISKAGDLEITGLRENVLVMRRVDNKEVAYRLDLTKPDEVLQSPVYYVQQNDVIYVEPNNTKKRQANANGNTAMTSSFWISVASALTAIAVLVFK